MNKELSPSVKLNRFFQFSEPFVVAELSGNHQQSLALAKEMVVAAADAGVDAIKLQTYTADTMTLPSGGEEFLIRDEDNLWQGQSLHSLYQKACTPWEWHSELFNLADSLGLVAFSSPFDASAVDFLESLNVPCYKIASFELVDIPLITKVAKTGKPLIMSTGMATFEEIREAVTAAKQAGAKEIVLLKCTSTYPSSPEDSNLKTIPNMHRSFECPVGISDHTLGIGVAVASVALGACMIEKHFTIDRAAGGVDASFSLEPKEFKQLVDEVSNAYKAMGRICYAGTESETDSKKYRRSIYISKLVKSGERLTKDNLKVIRPGFGLHPRYYDQILGEKVKSDLIAGTPLSWDLLHGCESSAHQISDLDG